MDKERVEDTIGDPMIIAVFTKRDRVDRCLLTREEHKKLFFKLTQLLGEPHVYECRERSGTVSGWLDEDGYQIRIEFIDGKNGRETLKSYIGGD